jgi:hypothetical protein
MQLYAVIWEDRHTDVSVTVFSDKQRAIDWAVEQVGDERSFETEPLTDSMIEDGWVWSATYRTDENHIRVQSVTLDSPK